MSLLQPYRSPVEKGHLVASKQPLRRISHEGALELPTAFPEEPTELVLDVRPIWLRMLGGELRVVETFSTTTRHYLVLGPGPGDPMAHGLAACLENVLTDGTLKAAAADANIGVSTLSGRLCRSLTAMGLNCSPSRIPLIVVLLAQVRQIRSRFVFNRAPLENEQSTLSIERPDLRLKGILTVAEADVARHLVDGGTHASIAVLRGVSKRTVANQLASTFEKLGVSCRMELIWWLLRYDSFSHHAPVRRAQ